MQPYTQDRFERFIEQKMIEVGLSRQWDDGCRSGEYPGREVNRWTRQKETGAQDGWEAEGQNGQRQVSEVADKHVDKHLIAKSSMPHREGGKSRGLKNTDNHPGVF